MLYRDASCSMIAGASSRGGGEKLGVGVSVHMPANNFFMKPPKDFPRVHAYGYTEAR